MNQQDLELMTLDEAAVFLRLSRSTLYQRRDVPRHRVPGSREYRYFRTELMSWLKSGDEEQVKNGTTGAPAPVLDIRRSSVYHRRPLYR